MYWHNKTESPQHNCIKTTKSALRIWSVIGFLFLNSLALFAQQLEIHHINVGQADATLIISPTGKTMLIDAGNAGNGTNIICPYLTSLGITKLNYVVCSHYHADHLGGLDEVINSLGVDNIDTVYDRGSDPIPDSTQGFKQYVTAANATGRRFAIVLGQVLDLGGVTMKCVATDGEVINYGVVTGATSSENDLSIGWRLSYNSFQYFTGGDLGGEASEYADSETPLASQVGDVDAMKINHHGSRYSTNQTFLDSLRPEMAVIPVGNRNTYYHPTQEVLDRLAAANCFIYQTELGTGGTIPLGKGVVANGNVIIKTSGKIYTVTYGSTTNTYPGDVYVSVKAEDGLEPKVFSLYQNYPNPFNPTTTISYQLPKSAFVKLAVYDVGGRSIVTLVDEPKNAGYHSVIWNGSAVPSGIYFYRIDAGEYSSTKKCILIK